MHPLDDKWFIVRLFETTIAVVHFTKWSNDPSERQIDYFWADDFRLPSEQTKRVSDTLETQSFVMIDEQIKYGILVPIGSSVESIQASLHAAA